MRRPTGRAVSAFFAIPDSEPIPLRVRPRLASWMARGHPDQVGLAVFLDHAESAIEGDLESIDAPVALKLDVGLPSSVDPLKHHDLDNYLYPLLARLGPRRFASAWATKQVSDTSSIRADRARPVDPPQQVTIFHVTTTHSAESVAWKQEVQGQLVGATEISDGPVELELSFRVSPSRSWANLWKPAIDSLSPILGSERGRPWNPRDGRVVRLGLHHVVDRSLGHGVEILIAASVLGRRESP